MIASHGEVSNEGPRKWVKKEVAKNRTISKETFQYVDTCLCNTNVTSQTIIYPNPNPNPKNNP